VRLEDLRKVSWDLEGSPEERWELAPAADVDRLVAAVLRLHHDPGENPHSGRRAAKLRRLRVGTPRVSDGYWWTAPDLDAAGDKARIVEWEHELRFAAEGAGGRPGPGASGPRGS